MRFRFVWRGISHKCCRLRGSKAKPLEKYIDGVQSAKLLKNSNWLHDFPFLGFSMASSLALNFPNVLHMCFEYLYSIVVDLLCISSRYILHLKESIESRLELVRKLAS